MARTGGTKSKNNIVLKTLIVTLAYNIQQNCGCLRLNEDTVVCCAGHFGPLVLLSEARYDHSAGHPAAEAVHILANSGQGYLGLPPGQGGWRITPFTGAVQLQVTPNFNWFGPVKYL